MPRKKPPTTSIATIDSRDPWDKLPDETGMAFAAFAVYRDLNPHIRSLREAARRLLESSQSGTLEGTYFQVKKWADRYRWQDRIEAFTVHQDRARRAKVEEDRRSMEELHLQGARTLTMAALVRMRGAQATGDRAAVVALDPGKIESWTEAARLFDTGMKEERLTRGMATDLTRGLGQFEFVEVLAIVNDIVDLAVDRDLTDEAVQEAFIRDVKTRLERGR